MTELALLASELDVSERTLRRALSQGTLRGERPSPRRLRLTAAEKRYIHRSWKLLSTLRKSLRTESNVRFALLFGSTARGEDTPSSDIDLLVEMRDPSLVRRADLELKLEAITGREVQLTLMEDAQATPQLLAEAVREGRVIIDRQDRWPQLSAETDRLTRRGQTRAHEQGRRALSRINRLLVES